MRTIGPRYSKEEFARRGDLLFDREIKPRLKSGHDGDFVAIDIESGEYEIDADELAASDRLLARLPQAQIWLRKVGRRFVRRFSSPRARPMIDHRCRR